jgi:exo-beta-1,3-glucanase (GH17 family)
LFKVYELPCTLYLLNFRCDCSPHSSFIFDILKAHAKVVRTYSGSNRSSATNIIPTARRKTFKVVLGIW